MKPFLTPIKKSNDSVVKFARYTFSGLRKHFPEEFVCKIVWFVATEHQPPIANLGLNISSDGPREKIKLFAQS
jgi:hypothetical protein